MSARPVDMSESCPECLSGKIAGVELRGVYDGVACWLCLPCGHRWHRFKPGDGERVRAAVEAYWAASDRAKSEQRGGHSDLGVPVVGQGDQDKGASDSATRAIGHTVTAQSDNRPVTVCQPSGPDSAGHRHEPSCYTP